MLLFKKHFIFNFYCESSNPDEQATLSSYFENSDVCYISAIYIITIVKFIGLYCFNYFFSIYSFYIKYIVIRKK